MKKLIFILLVCLMIPMVISQIETLGTFKQNDCIELKQTCSNCTYINISSVVFPNATRALSQSAMTKTGTEYNKTFCNTSALGTYIVNGFGDVDGTTTIWAYDFAVTYDGTIISVGQSIIYISGLVFAFVIFLLLLYASMAIPFRNTRADDGKIISVNHLKWLKVGAICLAYVSLLFIFGLATAITRNFLPTIGMTKFFEWLYIILLSLSLPLTILAIVLGFSIFINDYVMKKKLKRRHWR